MVEIKRLVPGNLKLESVRGFGSSLCSQGRDVCLFTVPLFKVIRRRISLISLVAVTEDKTLAWSEEGIDGGLCRSRPKDL